MAHRPATVSGFVIDGSHVAPPGTCVAATPIPAGAPLLTTVRAEGAYTFAQLSAGSYSLSAGSCALPNSRLPHAPSGSFVRLAAGQNLRGLYLHLRSHKNPPSGRGEPDGAGRISDASEAPQQTATGSISGTVTSAASSQGLAEICVTAYGVTTATTVQGQTGTGGTYSITGLPADTYEVTFSVGCGGPTDFATQYYPNQALAGTAGSVSVGSSNVGGVDAAMQPGGTVSGTVTVGGSPAPNICVQTSTGASATTGASGAYSIPGVPLGGVVVYFAGCGTPSGYQTQAYPDATNFAAASPVVLSTAGQTASNINDALLATGTISGTVTAAGAGVSGVCVAAIQDEQVESVAPYEGQTTSGGTGTYTITGLESGPYFVSFSIDGCGSTGNFAPQYYAGAGGSGAAAPGGATVVNVGAGTTATGIDAALQPGATITGTVSPATSGICVSAQSPVDDFIPRAASTNSSGAYSLTGLEPGPYTVQFSSGCGSAPTWITEYYPQALSQATATELQLVAGQTKTGVDTTLVQGGTIQGSVTSGGTALAGACVDASTTTGQGGFTTSTGTGSYSIAGLPSGSYTVSFSGGCGASPAYAVQYYDDASSQASATLVKVTDGQTTTGIDAALVPISLATVTFTVTLGSSSLPGSGVCESGFGVFSAGGGAVGSADGMLTVSSLQPGSYTFYFSADGYCGAFGNYVSQTLTLSVAAGANLQEAVNLPQGATIAGTVSGPGGGGVGGVCAVAANGSNSGEAATGAGGAYSAIGLAPGTYVMEFSSGCGTGVDYVNQEYTNSSGSSQVSVTAGQVVSGINVQLSIGGEISGTVTSTSGLWLTGICAMATPTSGGATLQVAVASYYYRISGLPAGNYTVVFFTGCGYDAPDVAYQYYQDALQASSSTPVPVTAGQDTSSIDVVMSPGGAISGTVTAAGGGPLAGICVAYGPNDPSLAQTAADGTYTFEGLPAGSSYVEFFPECGSTGSYQTQYYYDVTSESAATPVKVSVGQTTPNINDAMGAPQVPSAPGTPSGVAEPSAVSLSWSAPSSHGGSAITTYVVTPYVAGVAQPPVRTGSSLTSYTVTGLTDGTQYTFTVAAVNGSGEGAASAPSAGITPTAPAPATYTPLTPYRICDTRSGNPSGLTGIDLTQCEGKTLGPGGMLTIQVAGTNPSGQSAGGVPSTATSVVLNVTVTNTTAPSYLTVWPAGGTRPLSSSVNWSSKETVPNLVTVALGTNGEISLYNANGNVDVVVDVEGWMDSSDSSGGPYVALTPYRICDTRTGFTPTNQCTGKTLKAASTLPIQVAGTNPLGTSSGGIPASGVLAADLTVTVTNTTAPSYLTVWPAGSPKPVASNLNFLGGETVANNVVVEVPASGADAGKVDIYNANGSTDVVVDVSGYYATPAAAPSGAALFTPMVPYRICDTRPTSESGLTDACTGHTLVASSSGAELTLQVAGVGGIPTQAKSVVLNVTVTNTTAPDYLTIYPDGATRPNSSNVNWLPKETVASGVTATLGADGALDFYIPQGSADLVVDVVGWQE